MLVLSRKLLEAVAIGGCTDSELRMKVTILEIRHGKVKLGIEASADVPVHRWEIWERLQSGSSAGRDS